MALHSGRLFHRRWQTGWGPSVQEAQLPRPRLQSHCVPCWICALAPSTFCSAAFLAWVLQAPTWPSALDSVLWWSPGPLRAGSSGGDRPTLQDKEPSYLERLEQLQAVLSSYLEKVGGARPGGGRVLGGRAGAASPTHPSPQNMLGNQMLPVRVFELEEEVRSLRKINRDLFDFSTHIITRPSK